MTTNYFNKPSGAISGLSTQGIDGLFQTYMKVGINPDWFIPPVPGSSSSYQTMYKNFNLELAIQHTIEIGQSTHAKYSMSAFQTSFGLGNYY